MGVFYDMAGGQMHLGVSKHMFVHVLANPYALVTTLKTHWGLKPFSNIVPVMFTYAWKPTNRCIL